MHTRAFQSRTSERLCFVEWVGTARKQWIRRCMYVSVASTNVGNQATTRPPGTRRHSPRDGQAAEEKCIEEEQGGHRGVQGVHRRDQGNDKSVCVPSRSASRRRDGRGFG